MNNIEKIKCSKCGLQKEPHQFYRNLKKKNGLESNCKACVLERKNKKYTVVSKNRKKSKQLRLCKKVKVLDVVECTFQEVLINRPEQFESMNILKELINGVLCQHDIQQSEALAMVG